MSQALNKLIEQHEKRDIIKKKLLEATARELHMSVEDYKIIKDKPVPGVRSATARKIISNMESGDSVYVHTSKMAEIIRLVAKESGKMATIKMEDEGYRVWII
jgi:predicted RNA-binding protein with PUA-like domain